MGNSGSSGRKSRSASRGRRASQNSRASHIEVEIGQPKLLRTTSRRNSVCSTYAQDVDVYNVKKERYGCFGSKQKTVAEHHVRREKFSVKESRSCCTGKRRTEVVRHKSQILNTAPKSKQGHDMVVGAMVHNSKNRNPKKGGRNNVYLQDTGAGAANGGNGVQPNYGHYGGVAGSVYTAGGQSGNGNYAAQQANGQKPAITHEAYVPTATGFSVVMV